MAQNDLSERMTSIIIRQALRVVADHHKATQEGGDGG